MALRAFGPILFVAAAGAAAAEPPPTVGDEAAFRAFLTRFEAGLHRFVNGDPAAWKAQASTATDASILGGWGGYEIGPQVDGRYDWAASQFEESGARVAIEYLSVVVTEGLAHTVSIVRSRVKLRGRREPVSMALRATHVFRREGGTWKLVHRHADHNVNKTVP